MILATRCSRATAAVASRRAGALKTRRVSASTRSSSNLPHRGPACVVGTAALADRAEPIASRNHGWQAALALAAATAAATAGAAASYGRDNNSSRRTASNAAAALKQGGNSNDVSSWSVEETKTFIAALGEAVGQEHVSTDEDE